MSTQIEPTTVTDQHELKITSGAAEVMANGFKPSFSLVYMWWEGGRKH